MRRLSRASQAFRRQHKQFLQETVQSSGHSACAFESLSPENILCNFTGLRKIRELLVNREVGFSRKSHGGIEHVWIEVRWFFSACFNPTPRHNTVQYKPTFYPTHNLLQRQDLSLVPFLVCCPLSLLMFLQRIPR